MRVRAREGLLDGVDAEEGGIWVCLGEVQEVDVDELLDVGGGGDNVFED